MPEIPSICYIFEILMTHSMKDTSPSSSCSCCSPWSPCSGHMKNHFYRAECITVSGFFCGFLIPLFPNEKWHLDDLLVIGSFLLRFFTTFIWKSSRSKVTSSSTLGLKASLWESLLVWVFIKSLRSKLQSRDRGLNYLKLFSACPAFRKLFTN